MPRRPARPVRVIVERLEERLALAAGIDAAEVYSWQLINTMRANPAQFADDIQSLYSGRPGTYHGYAASDPVWTDIRADIKQNSGQKGWTLETTLGFLRKQPALPGLLLQDDLSAEASAHTQWMQEHGYGHTGATTLGASLPGFRATPAASPDAYGHDPARYGMPMGENINYGYHTNWAFEAPYRAGTLSLDAHQQRLAYLSTMSYILDVGIPDLGHLRNLFGRPDGMTAGTTGPLSVANFDSIGINQEFLSYQAGSDAPNYYISTMRFDNVRQDGPKPGQYSGVSFSDANQNGLFDIGESYQLMATPEIPAAADSTAVSIARGRAPRVSGLRAIRSRLKGLKAVVVTFDADMDAASAVDLGAYTLATTGAGRRFRPKMIRLASAAYDPAANAVTLKLARPYRPAGRLGLTVSTSLASAGTGVTMASVFSGRVPR
ncbi:hypothetical protein TA3x_003110 [Tundrisphaera sp. TA3]|uniref:hypothetical protein n=1 Tax=Tundrisphaera sp. TA3 TaxID=3435775 RepID=UPI003EBC11B9